MRVWIFLALSAFTLCNLDRILINEEFIKQQSQKSSFQTYSYDENPFKGYTVSQLKKLLGLSTLSLKDTSENKNFKSKREK